MCNFSHSSLLKNQFFYIFYPLPFNNLFPLCYQFYIRQRENEGTARAMYKLRRQRTAVDYQQICNALTPISCGEKKCVLKVKLPWNVVIPDENRVAKGLILQCSVVVHLLDDFACRKTTKDFGYYIAVTTLESIEEGKVRLNTRRCYF